MINWQPKLIKNWIFRTKCQQQGANMAGS